MRTFPTPDRTSPLATWSFRISARGSRRDRAWVRVLVFSILGTLAVSGRATDAWAWQTGVGHRRAPLAVMPEGKAGFTLTDPRTTGLTFTNVIPESRHLTNQVLLNGSGIAAGDIDGDGRVDVFCAGFDNDNALFRNLGNWRFEEIGRTAGVALPGLDCTGAAFADLDGDGDLDLVVNTLGQGTVVLYNDGRGRFTRAPGVLNPGRAGMTIAVADVDGDGWLDLYIANYRTRALMDMPGTRMTFKKVGNRTVVDTVAGRPASDPEFKDRFVVNEHGGIEENGEPDVLYRNVGGTNFVEVSWTGGLFVDEDGKPLTAPPMDWGLSAMFRDVDGDGRPDLYVCNDFQSPDRLWLNQGGGRFRLAPRLALRRTSLSSMAVDFADVNRDGFDDFLVLEMLSRSHGQRMRWVRENFPHRPVIGRYDDRPQLEQNTLQLGRGDGTWAEVAQLAGLEAAEWAWAGAFVDVDLDGWEDLLVVNGMERAGRDLDAAERLKASRVGKRLTEAEIFQGRKMFPRLATPNLAFRNQGDLTFREVGHAWGFDLAGISQALALADLDNDGDLDVLVGNLNAVLAVYRNDSPAPRVAVRLAGRAPNTRGVGARIEVTRSAVTGAGLAEDPNNVPAGTFFGSRVQAQEMIAGGRYLSGDDPVRVFAAPGAAQVSVRVRWPDGGQSEIPAVSANTLVEVAQPERPAAQPPVHPARPVALVDGFQFEDRTADLNHRHVEEAFDDFLRQPLLPFKLSQPGPGVAWSDLDGDGRDDLIVGAGQSGQLAVFRNAGGGKLVAWTSPALQVPLRRDVTAVLGWPAKRDGATLLAALANYEDGAALGPAVIAWDPAKKAIDEVVPAGESSPGPLAMADVDEDGDLDLFVGGRVIPGRWPAAASSRLLRNDGGRFVVDAERSRSLAGIGLVSGAVFTDLDGDGRSELVLACEWGPVRVLRSEGGRFVDVTEGLGLGRFLGWWTSVAAGDFDGDGRMDLVAGNWGRNTPYESQRQVALPAGETNGALRVYHGDFQGTGAYDVLEAHFDAGLGKFVPTEQLTTLAQSLPALRERFPSHASFGEAGVAQVLGDAAGRVGVARADWLESTVFLNRGDHFEVRALPVEAQWAPVLGVAVADVDGDGAADLFVAQNFFAVRPHLPRFDAGTGVWLKGDGKGGFTSIPGSASGVRIYGEQRGAAVADYDGDGRWDLVVGQNGAETRLFRNVGGRAGVRVRLSGPAENPAGVGAQMQWKAPGSATQEFGLGGGYLSADSLVRVIARPDGGEVLRVRWPRTGVKEYAIPASATEVELSFEGRIRVRP